MEFETPCTCTTLRRATRAVTAAYDAALAPSGLRITQFSILRKLARLGPLPVKRLAAEAALDRRRAYRHDRGGLARR
jgi:DNA-binding MarR family transcriptional regulator